ncbi:Uncharacterized protein BP5553_04861 [Venustampulla echinocandica]|uniref:Uncharacterized protein n=1 Tax=Venustampulla echinocandica TaxID=2656787 RepID=A0A370TPJ3_9HELO|nr:Uncharacterized protein BP5553_04861 [Venustampulla echinocandica]RDL37428.1 Uncharacterized protein BP5553_04861 [Venustampulla echinocandica]
MSPRNSFKLRIILLALASLITITSALSSESRDQQPLRSHEESKFSVGFSLQSSYGAAAVIFEGADGRLRTHTRVYEPGYMYQQVMAKLSLQSSQHIAPPYDDDGEFWADMPRRGARMALKTIGLPASYEVGVLAQAIKHLRSQLESDFSISISEAVFTSSHLLALYQDDLEDVAVDVGIKYVTPRYQFQPILWETAAAYAGYGFGICKHWRDEGRCWDEESTLPDTTVLGVHYSHNALTVSLAEVHTAFSTWEPNYRRTENFTLGSDAISGYSSPKDYWADVKGALLEIMDKYPLFNRPKTIIVTGDVVYGNFMNFLKETLNDYLGKLPPILSADAKVVSAMGAAEFMRRC